MSESNSNRGSPHSDRNSNPRVSGDVCITRITEAIARDSTVHNTKIAYDRIRNEWKGYCQYKYGRYHEEEFTTQVTGEKLCDFLFYQSFRSKSNHIPGSGPMKKRIFDPQDYEEVKREYNTYFLAWQADSKRATIPHPSDGGIGISAFIQYRAVLHNMFKLQASKNQNNLVWEGGVWTPHAKILSDIVHGRKARMERESFKEKVSKEFSGYQAARHFHLLELAFWEFGLNMPSIRSSFPYIRYRMMFLYTTAGILRCESVMKARLSDFLGVWIDKKDMDIHPMYVMINKISEGMYSSSCKLGLHLNEPYLMFF